VYDDPRIVTPQWVSTGDSGGYTVRFDIMLEPGEVDDTYRVDGYYASKDTGGFVLLETEGSAFWATEVPNPRTWGSVGGVLAGLALQRADLGRGGLEAGTVLREDPFGATQDALSIAWTDGDVWSRQTTVQRE
jgi:hypothetical protein